MRFLSLSLALLLPVAPALGQIVSYEAISFFPEEAQPPWERETYCTPERWIEDGWLYQYVQPADCGDPPGGDKDCYVRSIGELEGAEQFFVEWRVRVDTDSSEIPWGGGACLAAGSLGIARYIFFIADDLVELHRDNLLPIIFVDIEPGVPHTYRLEHYGADLYIWYVDGHVADSDIPEGPYPWFYPSITWGARAAYLQGAVTWDFIRYGVIPVDGTGDYNTDGQIDSVDCYFFQEYFSGADVDAGPGARWADFDFDTDVDLRDFAAFQNAFTGPVE